jgi:antitoxin (DNA-binding transcriptional repressor) of toxin-antitoxin stability system
MENEESRSDRTESDKLEASQAKLCTWERIMNVSDVERNFAKLVEKVYVERVSIDVERDDQVIARLTPAERKPSLKVGDLNAFLQSLPSLGDDADDFAHDVRGVQNDYC